MKSLISRINYPKTILLNFVVLSLAGVVLRYLHCFPANLNYLNILHAHSHFAFAGWMFMALALLISRQIGQQDHPAFKRILFLTLLYSFGMLVSFYIQGYKAVSIAFSTLFLIATYQFCFFVYRKALPEGKVFRKLLRCALVFLVISSLGPFALGLLKAQGYTGAAFQNSIYFYLHFQMNGWMLFAVLALVLKDVQETKSLTNRLSVFIVSTYFLFFMFTLWSHPGNLLKSLAILAALANAISWFAVLYSVKGFLSKTIFYNSAMLAITLKVILQVLVCLPWLGEWVFANRNLIIGYVHLLTLGCITPVILHHFTDFELPGKLQRVNYAYVALTVIYLLLLFTQPMLSLLQITIGHFQYCLLFVSIAYAAIGLIYWYKSSGHLIE
jgi:hypothetical protein